jgi:predicted oxidoreductase
MFWDTFRAFGSDYQTAVDSVKSSIDRGLQAGTNFVQADTLEDLADKMGVDKAAFLASVERYNGYAAAGVDEDFFKESVFVTPVNTPPYIGAKIGTGLLCVCGGLHVSDDCEVLSTDDEPVPGLYALGNVMGDLYAYDYPINIQGNSHGRCLTFGFLLGEHFAGK